jgi:hypothetical protein
LVSKKNKKKGERKMKNLPKNTNELSRRIMLIPESDYKEIEKKVYMITIKKITYILYSSDAIGRYIPFIAERFEKKDARWQDLLRYCSMHGILVVPIRMSGWTPGFINIKYLDRSIAFNCAIKDANLFETILRFAFTRKLLGEIE